MNIFKLAMENLTIVEEDMLNGVEIPIDTTIDEILDCRRKLELANNVFVEIDNIRSIAESNTNEINDIRIDTVRRLGEHVNIDIEITTENFVERTTDALVRIYEYIKSLFKKVVEFLDQYKDTTENNIKKIYKATQYLLDKYNSKKSIEGIVKLDNYKDKLYNSEDRAISYNGISKAIITDTTIINQMATNILPKLYMISEPSEGKLDVSPKKLGFGGYVLNAYQEKSGLVVFSLEKIYPIKQDGNYEDNLPDNSTILSTLDSITNLCEELMLLVKETTYAEKHINSYLDSLQETLNQTLNEESAKDFKGAKSRAESMLKVLTVTFPKFVNYNLINMKYVLEALDIERMYNRYKV